MINYCNYLKSSVTWGLTVLVSIFMLGGCSGGGGDTTPANNNNDNNNNNDTVIVETITGTVYAPDEMTPISGAVVYLEARDTTAAASVSLSLDSNDSTACSAPEGALAYDCSDASGDFSLDVSNVSETSVTLKVVKGDFTKVIDINTMDITNKEYDMAGISLPSEPESGAGYFAVVTGDYDHLEDLLAKSGMGTLDSDNQLQLESETFDIFNGNESTVLDAYHYPVFLDLFEDDETTGEARLYRYDMVLINAGNAYEDEFFSNQEYIDILKDYINGGGKLFATDWSYNFVEQAFPEFVDFFGSDDIAENDAEYLYEAAVGVSSITSNATVNDESLLNWLETITCEDGACLDSVDQDNDTVEIVDFLSEWVVMNGAHSTQTDNVKIWVSGPVSWENPDPEIGRQSGNKPLAIEFSYGQGKVLFSSFHTDTVNTSSGFWPQERILQYLVFEM